MRIVINAVLDIDSPEIPIDASRMRSTEEGEQRVTEDNEVRITE